MNVEYTKGPLHIESSRITRDGRVVRFANCERGHTITELSDYIDPVANARRIVACWNACLSIPTEALERWGVDASANLKAHTEIQGERDAMQLRVEAAESDIAAAERQCDELIEALRLIAEHPREAPVPNIVVRLQLIARTALIKHTPKVTV